MATDGETAVIGNTAPRSNLPVPGLRNQMKHIDGAGAGLLIGAADKADEFFALDLNHLACEICDVEFARLLRSNVPGEPGVL